MAFTGSATIVQVADGVCRITGLSLASGASGTISLSGGTGDVKLPATMNPTPYAYDGVSVSFVDAIDVDMKPATAVTTSIPVHVSKAGATPALFLATLTNDHGSLASPGLEIYVRAHT